VCGIVGYWDRQGANTSIVEQMALRLHHRGPDGAGAWLSETQDVAMAHRRLAIIDLSSAGHQPMTSPCGRFTLVFNGEIYNHVNLRNNLEKEGGNYKWRGHSDTETLLAALQHWGVEKTLSNINGMFAFAMWDSHEKNLLLARDRMGEKPLYYGNNGNCFFFTSELKALEPHPKWNPNINRRSLSLYMRHSNVPAPWSIFDGIMKLPAAHYTVISEAGLVITQPKSYWSLANVALHKHIGTEKLNVKNLTNQLDDILREAVSSRMIADVPVGAFLSGGVDSSTVAAIMQAQSKSAINTFTIGYSEHSYDESSYAKSIAKHIGSQHTELIVTPEEVRQVIPRLPAIWDEPFSDSSQIPTFLVSELASKHVKVILSGDGGDELFCGYNRYQQGAKIWPIIQALPRPIRMIISSLMIKFPSVSLQHLLGILPDQFQMPHIADRIPKLAGLLEETTAASFYRKLVSHWSQPEKLVIGGYEPRTVFDDLSSVPEFSCIRDQMMYLDCMSYLPNDILTKLDRASMAVGVEARVPLLDHRLVEFAWKVPIAFKYRDGRGKWLLREVLSRYVPRELIERPKMGFSLPIEEWLRGPLRDWAEDLLSEEQLSKDGYLNAQLVRKKWTEHMSGKRRWHYHLWDVLMFQAWLREQKSG